MLIYYKISFNSTTIFLIISLCICQIFNNISICQIFNNICICQFLIISLFVKFLIISLFVNFFKFLYISFADINTTNFLEKFLFSLSFKNKNFESLCIWLKFIFVYQKSLKRTFQTGFCVQNHLCVVVNSPRAFCS